MQAIMTAAGDILLHRTDDVDDASAHENDSNIIQQDWPVIDYYIAFSVANETSNMLVGFDLIAGLP